QLGRCAHEIRYRARVSVPDKHVKTLTSQIFRDPASDNAEADYTDIFPGSSRHWVERPLSPALPPVQPEAKTGIVQSRSSLRPALKRPQVVGFSAKIDSPPDGFAEANNQLLHRTCPFLIGQLDS